MELSNIEVGANTGGTDEGAFWNDTCDLHTLNNHDPCFILYQLHFPQVMAIVGAMRVTAGPAIHGWMRYSTWPLLFSKLIPLYPRLIPLCPRRTGEETVQ